MTDTIHLHLPYIEAAQAQKHVTHNEALRALDAIVMLAVDDRDLSSPPASPSEGARYLVKATGSGAFAGKDNQIAHFRDGAFAFHLPQAGWIAYVDDEDVLVIYDGAAWRPLLGAAPELQNVARFGLATTADATNPLSAKLNNALVTARTLAEGGDGDLRYKLNKEAAGNVLSLLLQTGFSGRAEIGLVGNDNLTMKVSPDGSTFHQGIVVDKDNGRVRFPQGIVHPDSGLPAALYIPAPAADIWRPGASRGLTPRTFTVQSVSGANVTLTTAGVGQIFGDYMRGQAAVRIWNMSKNPVQSAWVDWNNSTTQFRVTDAGHVATWANGETIRLGDPNPTGANVLEMVAVDISNYLLNNLGAIFFQKGVFVAFNISSSDGPAQIGLSGSGAVGSVLNGNALSNGGSNNSTAPVPTAVPSPISNSNLLFVRETLSGATDLSQYAMVRVLGVYV